MKHWTIWASSNGHSWVVGPATEEIEVMPVSDHKAQLEQAIEEFAERLAGELEKRAEREPLLSNHRRFLEAASLCRTLATEGRDD